MRIVKIMCRTLDLRSRVHYTIAIVGVIVFLGDYPLWANFPDLHHETHLVSFETLYKESLVGFYLLAKNKKKWQDLTPEGKEEILKKHKEWQSLPKEERKVLRQRMNQLEKMSPKERQFFKQLFQQWQHISPKDRRKLEQDLQNWEHLTPKQQESIRRRFLN